MINKVVHLTSVHSRYDTRIFIKECCSLSCAGYSVFLIVSDGKGDEINKNVTIFDVGEKKGRLNRIIFTTQRVLRKSIEINANIYHIHDPELIPVGLKLKKIGKKVIFDSHEDVPLQILGKHYIFPIARKIISNVFKILENYSCKHFDAIVTATPTIKNKFVRINPLVVDINNYPIIDELKFSFPMSYSNPRHKSVCYIGGIASIRGIREIVRAMELTTSGARLEIGGKFSEPFVEAEVKKYLGWKFVDELGFLDRKGVRDVLARSMAGLVTLHPIINYIDALPVKMFEYMSAGIPVIASHFPLWKEIILGNQCGICVDPLKPEEIAQAIDYLIENPAKAETMGKNGFAAIQRRYNWACEETKLLDLYRNIL